ncbi:MAG: CsgG/HfaB family protein [Cyanobacteria bacterium P01_A01_bin.17]
MPTHIAARIGLGILLLTGPLLSPTLKTVVAQESPDSRQQIAVVDFSYGDTRSPHYASYKNVGVSKGVSARMVEALAAEDAFIVVDPNRVQQALVTLNLTGPLTQADAISLGENLSADVVITGTITEFKAEQACVGGQCSPETMAQINIESSMVEVDSGNVATRRSNVSMTREQSGDVPSPSGGLGAESKPNSNVLDDVVDKAIANLVKGLTGEPDSIEFHRRVYP